MLLTDLVRHTPQDHPDWSDLVKATEKITKVAEYLNEQKRKFEHLHKVSDIQTAIQGLDTGVSCSRLNHSSHCSTFFFSFLTTAEIVVTKSKVYERGNTQ